MIAFVCRFLVAVEIIYFLRFRLSRSFSARSTSDFGTFTNFRARASNALNPLGFFGLMLSLLTFLLLIDPPASPESGGVSVIAAAVEWPTHDFPPMGSLR